MKLGRTVAIVAGVLALGVAGLVGYAGATAGARLAFADTPMPALSASTDPDVIARGKYLVHGPAHCAQCHSTSDRKHPEQTLSTPLQGGLEFAMGPLGKRYGRNLTSDKETGIGGYSDASIARTLRTGVTPDGEISFFMRYSASSLSDDDVVAVLSYLRSLPPVVNPVPRGEWSIFGKTLLTYAFPPILPRDASTPQHVAAADEPSVDRGQYLAESVMLCTMCHTRFDMATFASTGPKAGGSDPDPSHGDDSDMEFVAPNLTSHPTGITGRLDEEAFVGRMRAGRAHASSIMPWEAFTLTTESDLRSVYRYLRSLPPVDNDVGPTYRPKGS
jgi:mono/diheme cytochrome c family protein